ncbi:50S ribosomal protein L5 [Candidatus Campbellbacteria bacterium CG22_combo_CG10-13_8_21_14_all_36_13]|uniref:Large ribosomal subunit protein uL5 n=1 Tax=Candidatus Campbellbacteria bacterium CG22_combo_CG10-13_8_21_14_all_36_13 TaxID=1974529 RepID=A0A2H0DZ39_9BACT|nr:MAG: 50S ribosomal protein L5 [Candidatus Campbellbacteria bacterium CG22_combo_CG10-13_8_21_14_all_36_13]
MENVKQKEKKIFELMKEEFGYTNVMESPRLIKVVINTGVGSLNDKNKLEVIQDRLARITGQKPAPRASKKSIAGFKMRQGDIIGYQVTLRGDRMFTFIDKLVHIALPRTKDFRGLTKESIDEMGNITLGIKDHTVFPETSDEDLRDVFGFSITAVTTARNKKEAETLFKYFGFPFKENKDQSN